MQNPLWLWLVSAALCVALVWLWFTRRQWLRLKAEVASNSVVQRRNQAIVEASGEGVLELDVAGHVVFANPAAERLLGYEPDELTGVDYRKLIVSATLPEERDTGRIGYTTDMLQGIGAVLQSKHGRKRPVEYRMLPVRHQGATTSLIAFRDLTERSRIDIMLADMQHLAKVGGWEISVGSARLSVTEGISRRLRLSTGRTVHARNVLRALRRRSRRAMIKAVRGALTQGRSFDIELCLKHPDAESGSEWLRCLGKPERVDGTAVRLYGAVQDVTERKQAEQQLRQTRDFFGATLDALPMFVAYIDSDERLTYCNHASLALALSITDVSVNQPLAAVLHEDFADLLRGVRAALQGRPATLSRALPLTNGQFIQVHCSFVPQPKGCLLILSDVTELKLLEARLHQAEKMQAVGQLTGGIAHDFNNLLGIVLGNLQLLERDVSHDTSLGRKLTTAMRAAMRGTDLTKRLLGFARRQVLEPVIIDPAQQVQSFTELMQRTLGDAVETRLQLAPDCWHIKVDISQLENAILNLAINARDAMPEGGVLTVAVRNLRPTASFRRSHPELADRDYVQISVSDTGTGIPPQLLGRIFEPFFTTKESGKGSGLGLSMVHGFATQSGGVVQVHSTLGKGTSISLYLPRCLESVDLHETGQRSAISGGDETILVVEDDTDLRATTVLALQHLGYRVLEASGGEAALAILKQSGQIDMLFTDVIMPGGMLGTELAMRARLLKPGIAVLLTTGYLGDPVLAQAGLLTEEALLPKPYRNDELACKLRTLLK